jgi:hypothetical protein
MLKILALAALLLNGGHTTPPKAELKSNVAVQAKEADVWVVGALKKVYRAGAEDEAPLVDWYITSNGKDQRLDLDEKGVAKAEKLLGKLVSVHGVRKAGVLQAADIELMPVACRLPDDPTKG